LAAAVRADALPVEPGDVVVLAIGVVVAALGPAEFVAAEQHGRAARQQQDGQHVAHLHQPHGADLRIVGRPLDAVIGRKIVAMAVAVVLAVRLVVLVVVGDEIG
jgi:hypothetical protein